MHDPLQFPAPERLAELFFETYVRLAPEYGLDLTLVPKVDWADMHAANRLHLIATFKHLIWLLRELNPQ